MSFFLLPQAEFCLDAKKCQTLQPQESFHSEQNVQTPSFGTVLNTQLKSTSQSFLNKITHKNSDQQYALRMFELGIDFKAIFSIRSVKNRNAVSFFVDILARDDNYYKANNHFQAIQICRDILFEHSCSKQALACLKLEPSTRQIKMQLPIFLSTNWKTLIKPTKNTWATKKILQSLVQPQLNLIASAVKNLLKFEGRPRAQDFLSSQPNKNLQKISYSSVFSNIPSRIPCYQQFQNNFRQRCAQNKNTILASLLNNKVAIQPTLLANNQLFSYVTPQEKLFNDQIDQLTLSNEERMMKNMIAVSFAQNAMKHQNHKIQNNIELKEVECESMQKIGEGGFADIYLAQVRYTYPSTSDQQASDAQSPHILQRLALKVDSNNMKNLEKSDQKQCSGRLQHQLRIIQKMKQGQSIFLPKYYFPVNVSHEKSPVLKNSLFMEYLPCNTLAELLQTNAQWLSLYSKLNLMLSICNGLRYLRDFEVVHLDLKPNNIMTYNNSHIKLIDFGQSYHAEVCKDGFKPGFTVPYSPPEIFNEKQQGFTSKSDVFSFGVIFYQMLFNKCPFEINKSTNHMDQEMKKYLEYWYYSPEENQSYGQGEIIRIISSLISKCLFANPQDRPQLDWIAYTLRLVLETVN